MSSSTEYRMYGNWRRPRSTGMAGATFGTTMLGIGAVIVLVLLSLVIGFFPAMVLGVFTALAFVPLVIERDGRSGYERALLMVQWRRAHKRGEHIYSSGTFSRIPGGRYRMPGVLADTEIYEGIDAHNRPFGMIHMPQVDAYTIVLDAHPQGSENFDQDVLDQAVGNWSQMLTAMGETSDIVALVAVIETLPNTGVELYETVSQKVRADAPQLARDAMHQLATGLTTGGVRVGARIAITFKAQTAERKKDPSEQAVEIARRLPAITNAAARAGVPATPMSADEIMGTVRRSVDPSSLVNIERALFSGEGTGLEWADCGPRTQIEEKDRLVHDGAISVTWEMRQAPKSAIHETVLKRLLDPNSALPIKRVAIIYRPHTAADATDLVNKDHRDALAALSSGRGIATAKAKLEVAATEQSRTEVARGHGLTRFGLLITVTQPAGSADIPRVDALVRDLSLQSQLQLRRSFCWQAPAFWSSLGVGVIPPEHTSIPSFLSS
ncbi:SCO6880 family protein [Rhodococcus marinonascens]|uniref:SCO6880 family protein n=1 Tax=Rhodococcus marinonascens TaxID=38311 RepID=UPI0009335C2E|nr:SCO6880 family protein [Rhodococcus marinonascens]